MPNVVCDIHLTPIGTGDTSISDAIAAAEKVLSHYPDIKSQLNPMSTTLEGELDLILKVIRDMHEAPFSCGAWRVSTTIRIDDRRDGNAKPMADRIKSVSSKV